MSTSGVHGGMTSARQWHGEARAEEASAQRRTQRGILKFRVSTLLGVQGWTLHTNTAFSFIKYYANITWSMHSIQ